MSPRFARAHTLDLNQWFDAVVAASFTAKVSYVLCCVVSSAGECPLS